MNGFSSVSRDRLTSPPDHGWIGGKLGVRSISDRMPCTVNCLTNADTDDGTFAVYVEVPTVPRGRDRSAAIMGANLGRPSRNTEDIGGCFKIFCVSPNRSPRTGVQNADEQDMGPSGPESNPTRLKHCILLLPRPLGQQPE